MKYEGYPETKFRWFLKTTTTVFIPKQICSVIRCIHVLLFYIVAVILYTLLISFRQSLYSFVVEILRLWLEPVNDGILEFVVVLEALATQKGLQVEKEMIVTGCEVGAIRWMIQLFPPEILQKLLSCGSCVWSCIVVQLNDPTREQSSTLVLYGSPQFLQGLAIPWTIDRLTFWHEVNQQNSVLIPEDGAHDLALGDRLFERRLGGWRSVSPFHGFPLGLWRRVRHPRLVPCDDAIQELPTLVTNTLQKSRCAGLTLDLVFFGEHLWDPSSAQLPIMQLLRYNLVDQRSRNFGEELTKRRDGKSSILPDLRIDCLHKVICDNGWSARSFFIVNIFSSFIEKAHPSSDHWITHDCCPVNITDLAMNFGSWSAPYIQEANHWPDFTSGWSFDLRHRYKNGLSIGGGRIPVRSEFTREEGHQFTAAHWYHMSRRPVTWQTQNSSNSKDSYRNLVID